MAISNTDKHTCRTRIEDRFQREINAVCTQLDPGFNDRMAREIQVQTLNELGIATQRQQLQELEHAYLEVEREKVHLSERQADIRRRKEMIHIEIGAILDLSSYKIRYGVEVGIDESIAQRKQVVRRQWMATDPIGKQILRLEQERDTFLDLISMATTTAHYKEIWDRFQEMLRVARPTEDERPEPSAAA